MSFPVLSSEWLAYAEKHVEMPEMLSRKKSSFPGIRLKICRWIQIVPEVEAQGTNRRAVPKSQTDCVRSVVEPAAVELLDTLGLTHNVVLQAQGGICLVPAQQALQGIVRRGEDVPHVVKDGEAEALAQIGQADGGKAQFEIVDEQSCTADRETGLRIARPGLI